MSVLHTGECCVSHSQGLHSFLQNAISEAAMRLEFTRMLHLPVYSTHIGHM
jgi:hypothetical protein